MQVKAQKWGNRFSRNRGATCIAGLAGLYIANEKEIRYGRKLGGFETMATSKLKKNQIMT